MKKVAFITGAARGIGKSIALEFARKGYLVILNDLFENKDSKTTLGQIKKLSPKSECFFFDVSDEDQVVSNIQAIKEKFHRIDTLVNNAGITRDKTMIKMSYSDWDAVIKTNLYGPYLVTREVLPIMTQNEGGKIINISSIIGQVGGFGQTNYSAAKAGLIGLTKSLAKEVARHNITVNAICPGFMATEMTANIPSEIMQTKILPKIALNRLGRPEEVAKMALYLASSDGDYITGECININGGWL